jgi:hypothetical protein
VAVLRAAFALSLLFWLAPSWSAAQSAPYSPPRRLARPAPYSAASFYVSPAASVRLQALQLSLSDVAQREDARFWPASLQLALGVGLGTAAIFVHDPGLRAAFTLGAAISGARGILQMSFSAHVGRDLLAFNAIEVSDKASLWTKLRMGELALAHAAKVTRTERILEGCVGILGAASYLPVQYAFTRHDDHSYRFGRSGGDYAGLALSVIALASSLVQAIRKSPAELHYREYRALRRSTRFMP